MKKPISHEELEKQILEEIKLSASLPKHIREFVEKIMTNYEVACFWLLSSRCLRQNMLPDECREFMRQKGIPAEEVTKLWHACEEFSPYSFSKILPAKRKTDRTAFINTLPDYDNVKY